MISEDELLAIEKRCEAATPGPWDAYWETGFENSNPVIQFVKKGGGEYKMGDSIFHGHRSKRCDAIFTANARTDVPLLIANLREAQAELKKKDELLAEAKVLMEEAVKTIHKMGVELIAWSQDG